MGKSAWKTARGGRCHKTCPRPERPDTPILLLPEKRPNRNFPLFRPIGWFEAGLYWILLRMFLALACYLGHKNF